MGFNTGSAGNGSISGSSDVALNSPITNNILAYDASISKWQNSSLTPKGKNTVTGYYHPESYGAIGDGTFHSLSEKFGSLGAAQAIYPFVTALTQSIDFAAMQATANAIMAAGRGILYVSRQYVNTDTVYVCSNTGVVSPHPSVGSVKRADNTYVYATGNKALGEGAIFSTGSSYQVGYTNGSRGSNIRFEGVGLDGNKANQTFPSTVNSNSTAAHGISAWYVDNLSVTNCFTQNTPQNGVYSYGCRWVESEGNTWQNNGSNAPLFDHLTKNDISFNGDDTTNTQPTYTTASRFRHVGNFHYNTEDEAVQFGYAQDVIVTNNHITTAGNHGIEGDLSYAGGTNAPGNIIIADNFITDTTDSSISIQNGDDQIISVHHNTLHDTVTGATQYAIFVKQAGTGRGAIVSINNNTIYGIGGGYEAATVASGVGGIYCNAQTESIFGNVIANTSGSGITFGGGNSQIPINHTVVKCNENQISNVKGKGIDFSGAGGTAPYHMLEMLSNTVDSSDDNPYRVNADSLSVFKFNSDAMNFGNASATAASVDGLVIDGSSTVMSQVSIAGSFSDTRVPAIARFAFDCSGVSSINRLMIGQFIALGMGQSGWNGAGKANYVHELGQAIWSDGGYANFTSSGTVNAWTSKIYANTAGITITLLNAAIVRCKEITITNTTSGSVTVKPPQGQTISNEAMITIPAYAVAKFTNNQSYWFTVVGVTP